MTKTTGVDAFLGKLKEGVDQVVSGAQDKIQEAQLRAQLRTIEREKADQIAALGSAVYAMHRSGDVRLETLSMQFEALAGIEARLEDKQREIDALLATAGEFSAAPPASGDEGAAADRRCQCGAVLSPAANFCPACGRANPVEPV